MPANPSFKPTRYGRQGPLSLLWPLRLVLMEPRSMATTSGIASSNSGLCRGAAGGVSANAVQQVVRHGHAPANFDVIWTTPCPAWHEARPTALVETVQLQ